jgi:hypothetical protein
MEPVPVPHQDFAEHRAGSFSVVVHWSNALPCRVVVAGGQSPAVNRRRALGVERRDRGLRVSASAEAARMGARSRRTWSSVRLFPYWSGSRWGQQEVPATRWQFDTRSFFGMGLTARKRRSSGQTTAGPPSAPPRALPPSGTETISTPRSFRPLPPQFGYLRELRGLAVPGDRDRRARRLTWSGRAYACPGCRLPWGLCSRSSWSI